MCPAYEHGVQAGIRRTKKRLEVGKIINQEVHCCALACSKESIQRELWIPFIPPLQQEQCISPTPNEMLRKQTKYLEIKQLVFLVSSVCGPKDRGRIAVHWFSISSILFWTIYLSFSPLGIVYYILPKYHQRRRFYICLRRFVRFEI